MTVDSDTRRRWERLGALDQGEPGRLYQQHDMRIIGLAGPARSGKDTAAAAIQTLMPHSHVRIEGFAWRLKLSAYRNFKPDCTLEEALAWADELKTNGAVSAFVGEGEDDLGCTGRAFLQRYGTEAHREVFGPNFWVDALLPEGRNDCDVLVIPDVRFDNETAQVKRRGGEIWRLSRPGIEAVDAHASEIPVSDDLVDHVLVNDGTIADLHEKIQELL